MSKKRGFSFLIMMLLCVFMSVSATAAPKINTKKVTLTVGKTAQLKVLGTSKKAKWVSSKKTVATVNSNGKVTAKKAGSTTITAKIGKKSYKCKVTVKNLPVSLSTKQKNIYVKGSFDLVLRNTKSNAKWSTSNKSVVSIKKISKYKYRVTGKKAGKAKITAKVGSKKYTCTVTVKKKNIPAKSYYNMKETWTVAGQWKLRIDSVKKTNERNPYSDLNPAAVYIVTFSYENIGYRDKWGFMDGLYFIMDDKIVDSAGHMGYSYPGDITYYPQEVPIGAKCTAQVCIGVSHPGDFYLYVEQYDGNDVNRKAKFRVDV